jgi:hypothetical protein
MMKKMRREMSLRLERFSVTERRTGKRICECANEQDAIMMVSFNPDYRYYTRDRFILDQIIDVSSTTNKQITGKEESPVEKVNVIGPQKIKLPEGQGKPVVVDKR